MVGRQQTTLPLGKLRRVIDQALSKKPKTFNAFLQLIQLEGYEIKQGTHTAFKGAEQKKFIRLRSLGDDYSDENIRAVIDGKTLQREAKMPQKQGRSPQPKPVNLLVDIQTKLQQGKSKGYEQWAKIFNLKQMAQTINFLREHNLMQYTELEKKAVEIATVFDEMNAQIKTAEKRMAEVKVLQTHIINYSKTRDTYTDYRKAG